MAGKCVARGLIAGAVNAVWRRRLPLHRLHLDAIAVWLCTTEPLDRIARGRRVNSAFAGARARGPRAGHEPAAREHIAPAKDVVGSAHNGCWLLAAGCWLLGPAAGCHPERSEGSACEPLTAQQILRRDAPQDDSRGRPTATSNQRPATSDGHLAFDAQSAEFAIWLASARFLGQNQGSPLQQLTQVARLF
jgi:hypothetical protein